MTADELRAIPLFSDLSEAGLERLASVAGELRGEEGQVLALPGDPGSGMYVVVEGTVSVEMRGGWHTELGPGNFFGEVALLVPEATRVARVRAATPVRCVSIPREDFLALVESEPSLALKMLKELARRLSNV
ncbi:MAG TPA: cyclic nucleotide-binding domain-containing protein [Gaiellaceae bacterium]|nr:cyclic nucleotide-binding domain-containing protein [Gaiellaceae bacterium]